MYQLAPLVTMDMGTREGPNPPRPLLRLGYCCTHVACSMPIAYAELLVHRFVPPRPSRPTHVRAPSGPARAIDTGQIELRT